MFTQKWIFTICRPFISPTHRKLMVGFSWACFGEAVCNTEERGKDMSKRNMREKEAMRKNSLTFSIK